MKTLSMFLSLAALTAPVAAATDMVVENPTGTLRIQLDLPGFHQLHYR